jgi:hypothetical protein
MPTNSEKKTNGAANGHATDVSGNTTAGVLGSIQQRVTSRVDAQKNRAADGLGGIADVIRTASNELRSENEALASYVDMAGDQMRKFANHIRERGAADMIDDVNRFARRNPAVFIGGAFLLGIGVARFLKASADRTDLRQYEGGFSDVDPMTATTAYSGFDESNR